MKRDQYEVFVCDGVIMEVQHGRVAHVVQSFTVDSDSAVCTQVDPSSLADCGEPVGLVPTSLRWWGASCVRLCWLAAGVLLGSLAAWLVVRRW